MMYKHTPNKFSNRRKDSVEVSVEKGVDGTKKGRTRHHSAKSIATDTSQRGTKCPSGKRKAKS
jgi:hypothetical protein